MREKREILRIIHGSHLYGTNTPTSDQDFKAVFLPSGKQVLLGNGDYAYSSGPEKANGAKNQAGDVDIQHFSVQKLVDMLTKGDIVGMELLFCPSVYMIDSTDEWFEIVGNRDLFLTSKVEGYVGYCRQQANKYGIRGSRVASVRGIVELLAPYYESSPNMKLGELEGELKTFVMSEEHASLIPIMNGGTGKEMMHLEVINRKTPFTIAVKEAYRVYKRAFDEYGERARMAEKNEGVDWKAISHAVRVGHQAIELLETQRMIFPRPDAERLKVIKAGERPYKEVSEELDELLTKVLSAVEKSTLPPEVDRKKIDDFVCYLHHAQVV